jgi:Fe2+ or Zn2+ uptake regulation protein
MNVFRQIPTGALQCAHTATTTELLPQESRHHAKLKCADCGAFLKFLPRPENVERRKLNGFRLAKLQMCDRLNSWEREFIEVLAKQGSCKLTPKQQAVLDRLCLTYLDGRAV